MRFRAAIPFVFLLSVALFGGRAHSADAPKPEIKGMSALGVPAGKTTTLIIYGENLAPKEAAINKPPITVKLLETKPTEGDAKARGSKQVTVEITVPASCPPDAYSLILIQPDNTKATTSLPVFDAVATELPVKKPASSFPQAMPLPGPSVAVSGAVDGGTADIFRFDSKSGETWDITLTAGRGGSMLDPILRVRDQKHFSLALSAGEKQKDRRIAFHAPSDGTYYIEIIDAEEKGGPTYAYHLSLIRKSSSP